MNCASCGAPLQLTEDDASLTCPYCGSLYTPPSSEDGVRVLGETSKLACPVCTFPLEEAALAGHRVRYCTHCMGMLVPMGDFVDLIAELHARRGGAGTVQPPINRNELQRHLVCPQCHQPMDTHVYEGPGNIVIDDCSRCFLNWLDKGELTKVGRAPDHYTEEPLEPSR